MLAQENSCPSEGFPNHAVLSATLPPLIRGIHPECKTERISISTRESVFAFILSSVLTNALVVTNVNGDDSPWTIIANFLPSSIGGLLFFRCNYDINYVKVHDDLLKFYKNLIWYSVVKLKHLCAAKNGYSEPNHLE